MHIALVDLHWRGHHTPYVSLLVRSFVTEGHEVTFVTDERHERLDDLPDFGAFSVELLRLPEPPDELSSLGSSLREQYIRTRRLRQIFETTNDAAVDLVHFLYFDRTQIPLYAASTLGFSPSVPVFGTLHHDMFTGDFETGDQSFVQRAVAFSLSKTLESGALSRVFVHAESMRERILRVAPSIASGDVATVPAPTPDPIDVSQREARRRLDLPVDPHPMLLFFGQFREEKGPDLLARALRETESSITVVYAGSLSEFSCDDFSSWKRHADDKVSFIDRVGFVPEDEVDLYFTAADALVLPYRRRRGISGPLRRAAVVGTPSIGPRDTDVGEIIARHGLGTTFEYRSVSSLRDALRSVEARHEWTPPREFVDHRMWHSAGQRTLDAYHPQ